MGKYVISNGQFYWRRHRSGFGVWKKIVSPDGIEIDDFIRDFSTHEEAKAFVYYNNGWLENNNNKQSKF
jgi:hypothetical protein